MVATRRKTYGSAGGHGRWSELIPEILESILRRLTIGDLIRCGAVCKSWRSVVLERQWSPVTEPPWVIPCSIIRGVIRLPERKLRKMDTIYHPRWSSDRTVGSSNGWVGLQRLDKVHLFHPLKGTVLILPSLLTIPGVIAIQADNGAITGLAFPTGGERVLFTGAWFQSLNGIFLLPPRRTSAATGVAAVGEFRGVLAVCPPLKWRLVFVGPEEDAWSLVDMAAPVRDGICSVTSYGGSVCAVDVRGRVAAWDAGDGEVPRFTRVIVSSGPPEDHGMLTRYLVEADGELLQVLRYMKLVDGVRYRTVKACVFKLQLRTGTTVGGGREEEEENYHWAAVPSLGDLSLFLGFNSPAAFSSRDFSWLEKNCIYFTSQCCVTTELYPEEDSSDFDLGVYHLSTGTMRPFEPSSPCLPTWSSGCWFVPML